jgi:hypothetical protein
MTPSEQTEVGAGDDGAQGEPGGDEVDHRERAVDRDRAPGQRADRPRGGEPGGDGPDGGTGQAAGGRGGEPQPAGSSGGDGGDAASTPPPKRGWFGLQSETFFGIAQRIHLGALATGVALIVLGVLLLGGTQVAWRGLLDAVLAVIGLVLVLGSRRSDGRRGLVVVGLLLAIVMLGVWRADVPLRGGMRWHTVSPTTSADLAAPYQQTAGSLTVDLRHFRPPAPTPLVASIGVGRLVVIVPPGTILQGTITVGEGRVSVVGVNRNGFGLEVPLAAANVPALARADLRVGVGTVEVQVGKSP